MGENGKEKKKKKKKSIWLLFSYTADLSKIKVIEESFSGFSIRCITLYF